MKIKGIYKFDLVGGLCKNLFSAIVGYIYEDKTEISKADFELLKTEYELMVKIVWINEKYGIILDNYYEFFLQLRV